jgi:signal transduction histidine kinase
MSATARARQFAVAAARRRVDEDLRTGEQPTSSARRVAVLASAAALFAAAFALRLAVNDPGALIANFYIVPIAMLAIEFGARVGVLAAAFALALVFLWSVIETIDVDALGYTSRGAAFLVTGVLVGRFSERLRHDIAERQRAQRHLSLYADELERANQQLGQSVERLEAFAEIARAVGGETDLDRVLALVLAHGSEVVGARRLLVCVPDGEQLVALSGSTLPGEAPVRLPLHGSLAGEVLAGGRPRRVTREQHSRQLDELTIGAQAAILVPLYFRGETLGVLAGIDHVDGRGFEEEDEQLLLSVAASAATAVATARTVAADRLRVSLEAAEQARRRWARELHDETLQGLIGVRMVLAAGLARAELGAMRKAAEAADEHLGAELTRLRDLITELRPAALDDLGLGPAIDSLAKRQAAIGGFTAKTEINLASGERLPRDTESAIYRIVQEALSNAVRHADAQHVRLGVDQRADHVEISVEDDGRGFEPSAASEGFGLTGMRERAVLAGGHLSVSSAGGGPTCVTAVLPVPPAVTTP